MSQFHFFHESEINSILSKRIGETKLGEVVQFGETSIELSLNSFTGKYVIVGVAEDIGPQANLGRDGANAAFDAFLSVWLNMQSNRFFDAKDCLVLGKLNVESDSKDIEKLRSIVSVIDDELAPIFEKIFLAGKTPIVIGGGHNNAYPIIKAYHKVFQKKMKIINLDPHADFRLLEGRHSGNSFSYAMNDGFIERYGVIGLHKAYNSESMLIRMDKANVFYTFFEDYLFSQKSMLEDTSSFIKSVDAPLGVELDLDGIENMPSSAMSPVGWTPKEARGWLLATRKQQPAYYHFPEGAPEWSPNGKQIVGKMLSYLVSDVIAV